MAMTRREQRGRAFRYALPYGPLHGDNEKDGEFIEGLVRAAVLGAYPGRAKRSKMTKELAGGMKAALQFCRRRAK